jgi:hypothetical protein
MTKSIISWFSVLLQPKISFEKVFSAKLLPNSIILTIICINLLIALLQLRSFDTAKQMILEDMAESQASENDIPEISQEYLQGNSFLKERSQLSNEIIYDSARPTLIGYFMGNSFMSIFLVVGTSVIAGIFFRKPFGDLYMLAGWSTVPVLLWSVFQLLYTFSLQFIPTIGAVLLSKSIFDFPYWQVGTPFQWAYFLKDIGTFLQQHVLLVAVGWQLGLAFIFSATLFQSSWWRRLLAILAVCLLTVLISFFVYLGILNLIFWLSH